MAYGSIRDERVSSIEIPVIQVKAHSLARRLRDVESSLSQLPLDALVSLAGCDVSHVVVDAVIELEKIRLSLSGALDPRVLPTTVVRVGTDAA